MAMQKHIPTLKDRLQEKKDINKNLREAKKYVKIFEKMSKENEKYISSFKKK